MLILKILFTFIAVFFTIVNAFRLTSKQDIPSVNFYYQAIGITGLIVIFFFL